MTTTTLSSMAPEPLDPERRAWLIAATAAGGVGVAAIAVPFVSTLAPSERARAMGAAVEVDISDILPGGMKTVEWRGKPVWIVRRTPEQLAALASLNDKLVDPQSEREQQPAYAKNESRAIKAEYFVAIGICTHLGCSPSNVAANSGNSSVDTDWPGGFFCPCHGSTFDLAGRVYKNKPAPTNLEIPPHAYLADTKLLIGEDKA